MSVGSLFTVVKVRELKGSDFYLGSVTPTYMKYKGCAVILFYIPSDPVSQALQIVWAQLAATLAGIAFMAVNCSVEDDVVRAFSEMAQDPDHPCHPFYLGGFPLIITYRKGWPQAYYNGELSYDAIQNYAITLACQPGYYEPVNDYLGVGRTLLDDQGEYDLVVPDGRAVGATVPATSRSYFVPEEVSEGEPIVAGEGEEVIVENVGEEEEGGIPPEGEVTTIFVEDEAV